MSKKGLIIITGGGTGGHVFPAIAISEELLRRGFDVSYVGSSSGMEAKLVPEKNIPFFTVKSGAIKNQGLRSLLNTLFRLLNGLTWSLRFLSKNRPVAVIGVGGYVSVPVATAAALMRIPLFLQEQNSSVGIANRILGKVARRIFLGFAEAESAFPEGKTIYTGNPLRPEFFSAIAPRPVECDFLLVMGGSQGAKAINEAVVSLLDKIHAQLPQLKILHQTGQRDYENVLRSAGNKEWYTPIAFIQEPPAAYSKAALVIARSGALTVSELLQCQRPALFVPFPRRGQNDQTANAYLMKQKGVAEVVEQGDKFLERFEKTLFELLNPRRLSEMANQFASLARPNALVTIGDLFEKELSPSAK